MPAIQTLSLEALATVQGGKLGSKLADKAFDLKWFLDFNFGRGAKGLITGGGGVGFNSPVGM